MRVILFLACCISLPSLAQEVPSPLDRPDPAADPANVACASRNPAFPGCPPPSLRVQAQNVAGLLSQKPVLRLKAGETYTLDGPIETRELRRILVYGVGPPPVLVVDSEEPFVLGGPGLGAQDFAIEGVVVQDSRGCTWSPPLLGAVDCFRGHCPGGGWEVTCP